MKIVVNDLNKMTVIWTKRIDSPIKKVSIRFLSEPNNIITVACHENNLKILRLFQLRKYKKEEGIRTICGYMTKNETEASIGVPLRWQKDVIRKRIIRLCTILFEGTYKDI